MKIKLMNSIFSKYSVHDYVLLKNGKIEQVLSIHYEEQLYGYYAFKYRFKRFFALSKWEDEIVKKIA